MTDDDLKKWRDLAEKATPGPWCVSDGRYDSGDVVQVNPSSAIGGRVVGSSSGPDDSGGCGLEDAAFIAAARQAVPALLDEIERLRARVLVPLTEQQVVAALHEGRAEARAATGDNAWTTLLNQRDALRAEVDRLQALEQELFAYRPLYGFAEVWAAENEPQRTDGERKLAQAVLDCRTKLLALVANKTEGGDS